MRDLRPFNLQDLALDTQFSVAYEPSELKRILAQQGYDVSNQIILVHFWNPDCACNRWNEAHVKEIVTKYQRKGVVIVTVTQPNSSADLSQLAELASDKFSTPVIVDTQNALSDHYAPDATPAAAVIKSGNLAYYGPYSTGAMCGNKNGAFVERTLDSLLAGKQMDLEKIQNFGCFCEWRNTSQMEV